MQFSCAARREMWSCDSNLSIAGGYGRDAHKVLAGFI